MGALTLKIFPFELRSWEIEMFWGFDFLDSFGSNIKIYINKNVIVQIEASSNHQKFASLLNNKGRQYLDSILKIWSEQKKSRVTKKYWSQSFFTTLLTLYAFSHCWAESHIQSLFTFVFDHSDLETITMLNTISQNYSCINLKNMELFNGNTNVEQSFQLSSIAGQEQLKKSSLCLLMTTNPKHEGYGLHLKWRQKVLRENFKCLTIGSLIDLSFPISFLGSNLNIVKTMSKGSHTTCQNLKFSNNPVIMYSNGFFERSANKHDTFRAFSFSSMFNYNWWSGLCKLSPSLSDVGTSTLIKTLRLRLKDLNSFSSIYFLNTTTHNISNLNRVAELKLFNTLAKNNQKLLANKLLVDQSHKLNRNKTALKNILKRYAYVPQNTFYESENTFINAEGFLKRTTKIVKKQSTKNSWQILRKFLRKCKNKLTFLTLKDNRVIAFSSKKLSSFKRFLNFQCCAIQGLRKSTDKLTFLNKTLILSFNGFRTKLKKSVKTRVKLDLDDPHVEGKNPYAQNSINLMRSSNNLRNAFLNFSELYILVNEQSRQSKR